VVTIFARVPVSIQTAEAEFRTIVNDVRTAMRFQCSVAYPAPVSSTTICTLIG
jgi:hypothetical protein